MVSGCAGSPLVPADRLAPDRLIGPLGDHHHTAGVEFRREWTLTPLDVTGRLRHACICDTLSYPLCSVDLGGRTPRDRRAGSARPPRSRTPDDPRLPPTGVVALRCPGWFPGHGRYGGSGPVCRGDRSTPAVPWSAGTSGNPHRPGGAGRGGRSGGRTGSGRSGTPEPLLLNDFALRILKLGPGATQLSAGRDCAALGRASSRPGRWRPGRPAYQPSSRASPCRG